MKHKEWKIKKPMLFVEKYGILIFPLTAGILFLLPTRRRVPPAHRMRLPRFGRSS